ncbi:hypothetical protein C8Q74DRAFT_1317432 [Fomes fomentarius]|nr:hypothetical protein C8Q74DRAFT_1317432 [Fomes fomentarius]
MVRTESGGNSGVVALACTAKCFQGAAIDALWQTQASLVPLVKCFPDDLLKETEEDGTRKVAFVRDPEPEDWTRVKMYAERIRNYRLDAHSCPSYFGILHLAGSVYLTLNRCLGTESLLPNLRSFEWIHTMKSEPDEVVELLFMLGPKVSSMDIVLGNFVGDHATEVANALSKYRENTDQLRIIRIASASCPPIEAAVLALGLYQQHLQEFDYTWEQEMSLSTVSHLSSLNSLQRVSICANSETSRGILEWAKDRSGHFFPSLQKFTLYTDSLAVCDGWLHTIRHPGLKTLTFTVGQAPSASALREFFVRLIEHPAHSTLHELRFTSTAPCARNQSQLHLILPETLSPLLQLNLTVLKLEPGGTIDIDDDFVVRMARAWPDLSALELNAHWRRYPAAGLPSRVTLMGLVPLAERCPNVKTLAMPMSTDVTAFEEEYEAGHRPTGGVSFKQCFIVGVGPSQIDQGADMLMIAGFLSDLCPHLVALHTSWTRAGPPKDGEQDLDVENQVMGAMWKQVDKYGREMARVRRQERMWMQ